MESGTSIVCDSVRSSQFQDTLTHVERVGGVSGTDDNGIGILDIRSGVLEVIERQGNVEVWSTIGQVGGHALRLGPVLIVVPGEEDLGPVLPRVRNTCTDDIIRIGVGSGDEDRSIRQEESTTVVHAVDC